MDNFTFLPLSFCLRAKDNVRLPAFKAPMLRGGLGYVLKRVSCIDRRKSCRECFLNHKCVYGRVFEPHFSTPLRKYAFVPKPYVLFASLDCFREKNLIFTLTLIGHAAEDLPYFIYAFDLLGREGLGKKRDKFALKWVKLMRPEGRGTVDIYLSGRDT